METNNREFIYIKYIFIISLIIETLAYFFLQDYLFYVSIFNLTFSYLLYKSIIKKIYNDIRNTIDYINTNKEQEIKDGDLGILYEEMKQLKKRTLAYEEKIEIEKQKLRNTIDDINHQMKTPLTSISINNELIEMEYTNPYSKEIDNQIDKINYLIFYLLTISRFENHRIELEYHNLPIQYLFDLSLQKIHSIIQQNNIKINIENIDFSFFYDEQWLSEAITNILKNNIEHKCSIINISFIKYDKHIKIIIHNDGEEMKDDDIPHIFERFYHSKNHNGTGIGLALTKEIINRHHGSIDAYNNQGVVFELLFPIYQVNEKH